MKKWSAEFGSADNHNEDAVFDIHPDVAEAFIAAIRNQVNVEPPRHAHNFEDLTATIAQMSRLIQHFEAARELAIVKADDTSPLADRKAIAIAAGMPPSRLYRVLEKFGRPKNRRTDALQDAAYLQVTATNMRNALAGEHISGDQRKRMEKTLPELEAQIAEMRAAQAADRTTEQ